MNIILKLCSSINFADELINQSQRLTSAGIRLTKIKCITPPPSPGHIKHQILIHDIFQSKSVINHFAVGLLSWIASILHIFWEVFICICYPKFSFRFISMTVKYAYFDWKSANANTNESLPIQNSKLFLLWHRAVEKDFCVLSTVANCSTKRKMLQQVSCRLPSTAS